MLPFSDKLRVLRAVRLAKAQATSPSQGYQQLRYWSTVPFRHGAEDVVSSARHRCPRTRRTNQRMTIRMRCEANWCGISMAGRPSPAGERPRPDGPAAGSLAMIFWTRLSRMAPTSGRRVGHV